MRAIVVLLVLIGVISCKKNDTGEVLPPPPIDTGNLLQSNAFLVDSSSVSSFTDVSITIIKGKTELRPKSGDILIGNPTSIHPDGFLRRVTGVVDDGTGMKCSTVSANLNEAFAQLNFSVTYTDTFARNATFDINQTGSRVGIKFQNNDTVINGVRLNGELYFEISTVKIEYLKKAGTSSPEKVSLQAEYNTNNSSLEVSHHDNTPVDAGEKQIAIFDLPVIRVPVTITTSSGPQIIILPFAQKLSVKMLPASISGKARWQILPQCAATLDVHYQNGSWTNLSTCTINANADSLIRSDFASLTNFNASLVIAKPELEIIPYSTEDFKSLFSVPNLMTLKLQLDSPNYSMKYNMNVSGEIASAFYTGYGPVYDFTGNEITKTLREGDWNLQNSFIDPRDGQEYTFKQFGTQIWMTQNLNYGYGCYDNNAANCSVYGSLYPAPGMYDNIVPDGWHIPTDAEWQVLQNYMKTNPQAWNDFAALPGGMQFNDLENPPQYVEMGKSGWWWSSTMATWPSTFYHWCYTFENGGQGLLTRTTQPASYALSVRCVKN